MHNFERREGQNKNKILQSFMGKKMKVPEDLGEGGPLTYSLHGRGMDLSGTTHAILKIYLINYQVSQVQINFTDLNTISKFIPLVLNYQKQIL